MALMSPTWIEIWIMLFFISQSLVLSWVNSGSSFYSPLIGFDMLLYVPHFYEFLCLMFRLQSLIRRSCQDKVLMHMFLWIQSIFMIWKFIYSVSYSLSMSLFLNLLNFILLKVMPFLLMRVSFRLHKGSRVFCVSWSHCWS